VSVLSYQSLKELVLGEGPMVKIPKHHIDELIQPASIDCPLGDVVYRVPCSRVPRDGEPVASILRNHFFTQQIGEGFFLEKGHTYVLPLDMELSLGKSLYGEFSPKSTIGRNDVFVRVLVDGHSRFDIAPRGYAGPLWVEATPLSYPVRISPGQSLTQMRIKNCEEPVNNDDLERMHSRYGIVRNEIGMPFLHRNLSIRQNGIFLHADLSNPVVGLEARDCVESVADFRCREAHDPKHFWNPVYSSKERACILSPGKFYLLRTKERVLIPPDYCAYMKPYDVASGEFRSHYAGFFDNGFGGDRGTVGVLEVRVRDIPFMVFDGQPICHFVYERTDETPEFLYGGNYKESGPSLAKNFKDRYKAWDISYWRS
jgi:dCTP deaminase